MGYTLSREVTTSNSTSDTLSTTSTSAISDVTTSCIKSVNESSQACLGSINNSVDNILNNLIFHPPQRDPELFYSLRRKGFNLEFLLLQNSAEPSQAISFLKIVPNGNESTDKFIVFSHGNASDLYSMSEYLKYLSDRLNVGIICYDYPGYGLSEGRPSEEGCYLAHEKTVSHLLNMGIKKTNIILMGQSLGTAMVIDYASKNNWVAPIVLISPFKSVSSVAMDHSLSRSIDKFVSIDKIKNVLCPVKIYHGEKDEVVNISHGKDLYKNVKNKQYEPSWIKNADHVDILSEISMQDLKEIVNYENRKELPPIRYQEMIRSL